jgi:hypothetical protein
MPPDGHRSEGTLSLSEVPYAGAKPFGSFLAFEKGTRCKSETASGSTRSNGYAPIPKPNPKPNPKPKSKSKSKSKSKPKPKQNQKIAACGSSYTGYQGLPIKPQTTTQKGVCPMPDRKCDCPGCKCTIKEGDHAYAVHGKHYCCEACAHHHKSGEECSSKGCHCAHPK